MGWGVSYLHYSELELRRLVARYFRITEYCYPRLFGLTHHRHVHHRQIVVSWLRRLQPYFQPRQRDVVVEKKQ